MSLVCNNLHWGRPSLDSYTLDSRLVAIEALQMAKLMYRDLALVLVVKSSDLHRQI